MKRILWLVPILLIFICGCSNEEETRDFKHYTLQDNDTTSTLYFYTNTNTNQTETYIVTDITPNDSEEIINALFYEIDDNDYIMLDEFSSCSNPTDYKNQSHNYFSDNKLYITRCSGGTVVEYTLDGTNTQKKDLSNIVNLQNATVKEVKDGYVFFEGKDSSRNTKIVKCSQNSYDCETEKNDN